MPLLPRPVPAAPKARPETSSLGLLHKPGPTGTRPPRYGNHHAYVKGVTRVFHDGLARTGTIVNNGGMTAKNPRIQSIYRYPVKGLTPEELDSVRLEPG